MASETPQSTVAFRLQAPIQEIVAGAGVTARELARERQKNMVPEGVTARELFWDIEPELDYECMDPRVIDCLSDVLCAFGAFAFVSDDPDIDECWLQRIKARLWPSRSPIVQIGSDRYRRLHMSRVRAGTLWLVETARADVTRNFFLIGGWHFARCQAGYLRVTGSPPLHLSDRQIQDLIRADNWQALHHSLHASDAKAVCVPGYDGEWLKFVFLDHQALRRFGEQLRACCAAHRVPCVISV